MQIHITEEARHLCFARAYLQARVPALPPRRRLRLALSAPLALWSVARRMLDPPPAVVRAHRIPRKVIRAYRQSPQQRERLRESMGQARALCDELGLLTPAARALWRRLGIA